MDAGAQILFVGTKRGLEARVVPAHGFPLRTIPGRGFVGLGWVSKLRTLLSLPWTALQCVSVLASFRPHLVMGMGGYVAGPMVLLAALGRRPTVIAEQNAVAGRTNRILGRFVRRVFLAFPESRDAFPEEKVRVTGNPVRWELVEAAKSSQASRWEALRGEPFRLLVFGGSQGARAINRAILDAIPLLAGFPFPLDVLHQSGPGQIQDLREAYAAAGISHRVVSFIDEMDRAYGWAHLVVCRAGATSLAEMALFGKPAILVPYPFAADDHQARNARVHGSSGAAIVMDESQLSGQRLAETLKVLAEDPARLTAMGDCARALARPEAADRIVGECIQLAKNEEDHG
jgi:UDP-N-acetylglucosamine--N-acetylmuramyl-(pentapeptide) pyrophosphoryl-undecaprenol N-acetylglucosamine transferase